MTSLEDGLLPAIALGDTLNTPRRVFMTKTFGRWLRKTTLVEQDLCEAVAQSAAGLVDAKLAGVLLKLDASRLSIELECGNLQEICHETQSHTQ